MKQILLSTLAILPLSLWAQDKQKTYTAEFKEEFLNACVTAAMKGGTLSEKLARETCDCSLDLLTRKYSMDVIVELSEENAAQCNKLILEATEPCREELLRKLKSEKE